MEQVLIKLLGQRGKELVYSNDRMKRFFDKAGSYFRPRGSAPQEIFYRKGQKRVDKWQIQILPWNK